MSREARRTRKGCEPEWRRWIYAVCRLARQPLRLYRCDVSCLLRLPRCEDCCASETNEDDSKLKNAVMKTGTLLRNLPSDVVQVRFVPSNVDASLKSMMCGEACNGDARQLFVVVATKDTLYSVMMVANPNAYTFHRLRGDQGQIVDVAFLSPDKFICVSLRSPVILFWTTYQALMRFCTCTVDQGMFLDFNRPLALPYRISICDIKCTPSIA